MTPGEVANAWESVTDEWIVRREKAHDDGRQWEVVHDWGGDLISDDTRKVLRRFARFEPAEEYARKREREARGKAVLEAMGMM